MSGATGRESCRDINEMLQSRSEQDLEAEPNRGLNAEAPRDDACTQPVEAFRVLERKRDASVAPAQFKGEVSAFQISRTEAVDAAFHLGGLWDAGHKRARRVRS